MTLKHSVPSAPNQSIIQGQILKIEKGPEGIGNAWSVKVEVTQDVSGYANFANRYLGKEITILVHPEMKKAFHIQDKIKASIFFQGDERGGSFFLIGDKVEMI
ncbi:hypothetical protein [Adhaeribacter radiodurans]|uniref:DUF3127 domain-containing protein n=1 Tax=Adhaeribacter radiodurans TaxID=2745197 RepID=A0A7L7LCF1_9BACT|nr:hypothetical protein [Adhaeribacter radiodurans]QMU30522.1 hypothetical protein HUW48_21960 [Adhaeribacter radiodurans]